MNPGEREEERVMKATESRLNGECEISAASESNKFPAFSRESERRDSRGDSGNLARSVFPLIKI